MNMRSGQDVVTRSAERRPRAADRAMAPSVSASICDSTALTSLFTSHRRRACWNSSIIHSRRAWRSSRSIVMSGLYYLRMRAAVPYCTTPGSNLFLKKRGDELLCPCPHAAPPPGVEIDTHARGQVVLERRFHARDQALVVETDVAFLVVRKRAAVEVGRTDRRPYTVHDHRLLVEQGGLVLVDLNPGLEQASIQARPVLTRQPVVVVHSRDHDLDIYAAPLRLDQRVDGGRVGHEIRIGEPDPAPRAYDRQVVHRAGR